jgi:hypothetical protein
MPQAKHNSRLKELFEAGRTGANDFWQKILPEATCGSLS